MINDTYQGLEPISPIFKAGTEELGFFSETDTYNRNEKPCNQFDISDTFNKNIDLAISKLAHDKKQKPFLATDCKKCERFYWSKYKEPCCSVYKMILANTNRPFCKNTAKNRI